MSNYYDLDILPIILNKFKVNNVIISGVSDEAYVNKVLEYCNTKHVSYTVIDSKDTFEKDYIRDYTLNVLPDLSNYDAIFLNDDPNWYTVYNELKIINENNREFPLVFICHNVFPHKRRDSYIDPYIIPENFRNKFSNKFYYSDIPIVDDFYHAVQENTPKNGVLTAIEDFLAENESIGVMDIKLVNGITILYPNNSLSKIKLDKLSKEIQGHNLKFDELSDKLVENQLLINYVSNLNDLDEDFEDIADIKFELDKKETIINDYENKIRLHDTELSYKDSQIETIDNKLNLKDAQIKNFESKLVNQDAEINSLNAELLKANNRIKSLKKKINNTNNDIKNKENEFNSKIKKANSEISSLKKDISSNEKLERELNIQLKLANNQLKKDIDEIKYKDNQILIKEKESKDKEKILDSMKKEYDSQLSKLESKEYCISCFKEEITNNHLEIQYLKNDTMTRKLCSPLAYAYLIAKSNPKELALNYKLYKALKNSKCFDIGYYLSNNEDLCESKWSKFFSLELHYVCNGFGEKRKFNKKYFNRNSKKELLDYIMKCP